MIDKANMASFVKTLAGLFHWREPKKPAKRYPTMVVSSPREIAAWNLVVEAKKQAKRAEKGKV